MDPHPSTSQPFNTWLLYSAGLLPLPVSNATLGPGNTGCQHGRLIRTPGCARENLPLALMSCVLWVLGVKANESLEASQKNNSRFYYVG